MILDKLSNSSAYESLNPRFKKAFDYLKSTDFTQTAPTKICLEEDKLYVIVAEINGKQADEAPVETHNQFIDIQVPIIGTETMGWIGRLVCVSEQSPYNADKDITFYNDKPTTLVEVTNGDFVIFFPEDGHAPGIGNGPIKKVIVKIAVE